MAHCFPNDSDGDALRQVIRNGSDLSKPMFIDFQVAVPNEASAEALANVATKLGYRVSTYESSECRLPWTCECSTRMLATYEAVVAIQEELGAISVEFGGVPDGWGTFGNGPNGQPPVRTTD
jgi:regulator of RNase E activity RraB